MSNTKTFTITGRVPFTFLDDTTGELAQQLTFLSRPTSSATLEYVDDGYEPNEHGGRTAMYRFTLEGAAGFGTTWFVAFILNIEAAGGEVTGYDVYDLDAPQDLNPFIEQLLRAGPDTCEVCGTTRPGWQMQTYPWFGPDEGAHVICAPRALAGEDNKAANVCQNTAMRKWKDGITFSDPVVSPNGTITVKVIG